MVPLLTRIDQQLAVTTDPGRRGELLAERACYLARVGDFEGAERIVEAVKNGLRWEADVRLAVRLMLTEGLLLYFRDLNPGARDRVRRANAIAGAANLQDLCGLTAVWLAHLEFECLHIRSAVALVHDALRDAAKDDWSVLLRGAMVVADMYQCWGDRLPALLWYRAAHRYAVAGGDQAAIGALMYNKAAFAIAHMRVSKHVSECEVITATFELDERELDSAQYFQTGTKVTALVPLVTLAKARALVCRSDFEGALPLLAELAREVKNLKDRPNSASVLVDKAWCHLQLGNRVAARDLIGDVSVLSVSEMDADDALVALSVVSQVLGGETDWGGASVRSRLDCARNKYLEEANEVRLELSKLVNFTPP